MLLKVHRIAAAILIFSIVSACAPPPKENVVAPATTDPAPENPPVSIADSPGFAPPTEVKGVLIGPNIDLSWKNNATAAGGNYVDFNMNPGEAFNILDIALADRRTFRHPDVAGDTTFAYRLRPFFGDPSPTAEITTGPPPAGEAPLEAEGPLEEISPGSANAEAKSSLRSEKTIAAAAPSDLTALLASPTSVDLRWKDHASDEDGYLVEIAADQGKKFQVCALLPPNIQSFKKTKLPGDTKLYFRARAFVFGTPSDTVTVKTP